MTYRMGWHTTNTPTIRPTPIVRLPTRRPLYSPGWTGRGVRVHGTWRSPRSGDRMPLSQIARRNKSAHKAQLEMENAQSAATKAGMKYESCVKKKVDDGWPRNDIFPCDKLTGLQGAVAGRTMAKKGKPGKCDKKGVTISNCHVDYNQWEKKIDKAVEKRSIYVDLAAAEGGVSRDFANSVADEILYTADPVGYTKQKQSEYDRYVADTGMDPPTDLAMMDYVASTVEEEEAGSIMPILLGVGGVLALGALGWTLFSN